MVYCTHCGALSTAGAFCAVCGTAQPPITAPPVAAPAAPAPYRNVSAPIPFPAPPRKPGNGLRNFLIVATLCLLLVIGLGIAGAIYAVRLAKQKAEVAVHRIHDAIAQPADTLGQKKAGEPAKVDPEGVDGILGKLSGILAGAGQGSGEALQADAVPGIPTGGDVPPCSIAALSPQSGARIPMEAGTIITTAWGIAKGDVESRRSLASPTAASVDVSVAYPAYKDDDGREQSAKSYQQTICNQDLLTARNYMTIEGDRFPPVIHDLTRLRISSKTFDEVKSSGKTYLFEESIWDPDQVLRPYLDGGELTRVEPQDVPYPMIVNDQRITLPAIHLTGIMDSVGKDPRPKKYRGNHSVADMYVIDDPLDPLVLLWKEKDAAYHDGKFRVEVVKIDYKVAQPVNLVEKQLTEQKRAVTYGIYFDFNQDTIKPESEPVLKEIVQAMTDNPAWKLNVEGHTDTIGGDAYNLDLSKRRAAAVRAVLVTRYSISPDRLSTDGFGSSRPVETNDTLEGRARNRRVELTRE